MSVQERVRRGFRELSIVVLGVAIALAGDGWREDLGDRRLGREFEMRLREDVSLALTGMEGERERFARVAEAADHVSTLLLNRAFHDEAALVASFLDATQSGFDRSMFGPATKPERSQQSWSERSRQPRSESLGVPFGGISLARGQLCF